MKRKPNLLRKIRQETREEKQHSKKQNKTVQNTEDIQTKDEISVTLDEQNKATQDININIKPAEKVQEIKKRGFFYYIYRIVALFLNLIISIFESFQWVFISVLVTLAVHIVLKNYNINITNYLDEYLNKFLKVFNH